MDSPIELVLHDLDVVWHRCGLTSAAGLATCD
jgi:hypothetical protein